MLSLVICSWDSWPYYQEQEATSNKGHRDERSDRTRALLALLLVARGRYE